MNVNTQGFEINRERDDRLIRAQLSGYWNDDVLALFDRELRHEVALARSARPRERVHLLIDARACGVQSPNVVKGLQDLAKDLSGSIERTAAVIKGALHKMQANRINPIDYHRVFGDVDEALAWLFEVGVAS